MKKLNSKLYLEYFKCGKKYFSNADNLCCEWWYCWSWYAIQQILMSEYMLWFLITMQSQLLVKAIHLWTFWSCTAKNIWQNNTSVIHKHIFLVFFSGLQPLFEKCERKVDTWDNSPLFEDYLLEPKLISEMGYPLLSRNFSKTEMSHSSDCWNAFLWPEDAIKYMEYFTFTQKNLKDAFDKALVTASETVEPKKSHRWVWLRTYLQSSFCISGDVIRVKAMFKLN